MSRLDRRLLVIWLVLLHCTAMQLTAAGRESGYHISSLLTRAATVAASSLMIDHNVADVRFNTLDDTYERVDQLLAADQIPHEMRTSVVCALAKSCGWEMSPALSGERVCGMPESFPWRYEYVGFDKDDRLLAAQVINAAHVYFFDGRTHETVDICDYDFSHHFPHALALGCQESIVVVGGKQLVQLYNVQTGQRLGRIRLAKKYGQVRALACNLHAPTPIGVGFFDGRALLIDKQTGSVSASWKDSRASVGAMAFNPAGSLVAIARSSEITLCDTRSLRPIRTIFSPEEFVTSLSFNSDGKSLASCAYDGTIRLYTYAEYEDGLRDFLVRLSGANEMDQHPHYSWSERIEDLTATDTFKGLSFQQKMEALEQLHARAVHDRLYAIAHCLQSLQEGIRALAEGGR